LDFLAPAVARIGDEVEDATQPVLVAGDTSYHVGNNLISACPAPQLDHRGMQRFS